MQRVSSPVEICPVVHFKANGKHYKVKMWKPVNLQRFFLRALLKMSMSFTEKLFYIFSSAIHDMIIDTRHSFISSAGCHHAERISCKNTEIWKLPSVVKQPLENVSRPAMSNSKPSCSPVTFSLLCMYDITTAWLCLYRKKDKLSIVFQSCSTHWQISTCPKTPQYKTDFYFSDFYSCAPLHQIDF